MRSVPGSKICFFHDPLQRSTLTTTQARGNNVFRNLLLDSKYVTAADVYNFQICSHISQMRLIYGLYSCMDLLTPECKLPCLQFTSFGGSFFFSQLGFSTLNLYISNSLIIFVSCVFLTSSDKSFNETTYFLQKIT